MRTKKLFEYLVTRDLLKTQVRTLVADLRKTFESKRHLFEEKRKTFTPNTEGETVVEEQSDIQSTVMSELDWLAQHWAKAIDVARQVEEGNTLARADVVLDNGTTLLSNVPATALLELDKRAEELHQLLTAIPTLDPARAFSPDDARGAGIYRARDVTKKRTKKIEDIRVVQPPTKEHPAQIAKFSEDIVVGSILEQEWSALLTPAQKSDLLTRSDEVRRALKTALHRANATELPTEPVVGAAMLSYVLGVSVGSVAQAGSRSKQ